MFNQVFLISELETFLSSNSPDPDNNINFNVSSTCISFLVLSFKIYVETEILWCVKFITYPHANNHLLNKTC